jgi:ABC-type branched-subunit amino acid transport system permease subunit
MWAIRAWFLGNAALLAAGAFAARMAAERANAGGSFLPAGLWTVVFWAGCIAAVVNVALAQTVDPDEE